jgi:hypothetical protein
VERGSFCEPPPRAQAAQQHLLGALLLFALADRDAVGAGSMRSTTVELAAWRGRSWYMRCTHHSLASAARHSQGSGARGRALLILYKALYYEAQNRIPSLFFPPRAIAPEG